MFSFPLITLFAYPMGITPSDPGGTMPPGSGGSFIKVLENLPYAEKTNNDDVSDNDQNYQPEVDNRNRTFHRKSTSDSSSDDDPPSPEVAPLSVLSASSMRATSRVRRGRSSRASDVDHGYEQCHQVHAMEYKINGQVLLLIQK
ncbi:unnamed protein product [Arctia plantaginis]|uniref:Uncharacterized protein n=1 Tax=Arctia plantaginis TaxID=874455 RepID=A0A8S0Z3N8_ARCPL|nr:unnamed protein product [Arctia plantaginis]